MTLPVSGPISINDLNTEFGYGFGLDAYQGKTWFKTDLSTGVFPTGNISLSQFYSTRVDDITPTYQFLQTVVVGLKGAGVTTTLSNINIGAPDPTRRIVMFNVNEYYPAVPSFSQSATVAGLACTRIGSVPEGSAEIQSNYAAYVGRDSVFISPVIATGTTANITLTCNAQCNWSTIGIARVTKVLANTAANFTRTSFAYDLVNPTTNSVTMPAGTILIALGRFGTTSISNTTTRWNNGSAAYYGVNAGADYQNLTRAVETRSFTISPTGGLMAIRIR